MTEHDTLTTSTALTPPTILGRIKNNWLMPKLLQLSMALSVFAGGGVVSGCQIENKAEAEPDFHALLSGKKIETSFHGVGVDKLTKAPIVYYTFADTTDFAKIRPGGVEHNGETAPRILTKFEQEVAEDVLMDYMPQTCNIYFLPAKNPKDAYLRIYAADLSNYKTEHGTTGAGGYATFPAQEGGCLVLDANLVSAEQRDPETGKAIAPLLRKVAAHEVGHGVGLKHGFRRAIYNPQVFSAPNQTQNTSIMNYDESSEDTPGGKIIDHSKDRFPQTFQRPDLQALQYLYGPSMALPLTAKHDLSALPVGWVGTNIGSPEQDTLSVGINGNTPWFDLRAGQCYVSSLGGMRHTWNSEEFDVAEVINFNAGGVFIGGEKPNTFIDSAGNSLFVGNQGNDTLITGTGKDIIVIKAGDGSDVVRDYDPEKDIIEYDKGITGYKAIREGENTKLVFHSRWSGNIASIILEGNHGKVGVVRKAILPPPDCYQQVQPTLVPGKETIRYWHDDGTEAEEVILPAGTDAKLVELSTVGENSRMAFLDKHGKPIGSILFRGHHDLRDCRFQQELEGGENTEISLAQRIKGTFILPTGVALTYQKDGRPLFDHRTAENKDYRKTPSAYSNADMIAAPECERIFVANQSYTQRDESGGIGFIVYEYDNAWCGLNRIDPKYDKFAVKGANSAQVVEMENGQQALLVSGKNGNMVIAANHITGSLLGVGVEDMNKHHIPVKKIKLSELPKELQQHVKTAVRETHRRAEALSQHQRFSSLLPQEELKNFTLALVPGAETQTHSALKNLAAQRNCAPSSYSFWRG